MEILKYTGRLFSTPSFLKGMTKVLDLGNTLNNYNDSTVQEEADRRTFQSDADALKNDMKIAFDNLKKSDQNTGY